MKKKRFLHSVVLCTIIILTGHNSYGQADTAAKNAVTNVKLTLLEARLMIRSSQSSGNLYKNLPPPPAKNWVTSPPPSSNKKISKINQLLNIAGEVAANTFGTITSRPFRRD